MPDSIEVKSRLGVVEKHDTSVGAQTNKQLAAALTVRPNEGGAVTDVLAEWIIVGFTVELSGAGTFVFTDGAGNIGPTWDIKAADPPFSRKCWMPVGRGKLVAYTTTGAVNPRVSVELIPRRYNACARQGGAE